MLQRREFMYVLFCFFQVEPNLNTFIALILSPFPVWTTERLFYCWATVATMTNKRNHCSQLPVEQPREENEGIISCAVWDLWSDGRIELSGGNTKAKLNRWISHLYPHWLSERLRAVPGGQWWLKLLPRDLESMTLLSLRNCSHACECIVLSS